MAEGVLEVSCECPTIYEATCTPGSERSPSIAVLDAVACAAGVDVNDLPPLYESFDPDAIDRIFTDDADEKTVIGFQYQDRNVFVRGDGRIRICDAEEQVESAPVFERPIR